MKTRFGLYLLALLFLNCKAQTPILPLFNHIYGEVDNAYYKDTHNDFDAFMGAWTYASGNQEFTIILDKKLLKNIQRHNGISYYTDYMFGEFKYIDTGGNTLINTTPNITNTSIDVFGHQVFGNGIVSKYTYPKCDDCLPNERRIKLTLKDPDRDYLEYKIILRTVPNTVNPTVSDLQVFVIGLTSMVPAGQPTESRIPYGEYLMIKQ